MITEVPWVLVFVKTGTLHLSDICNLSVSKCGASLVAQMAKNLPAMWEPWVQSLGQEDPLEKGMATHFSILAQRIQWTEEPGRLESLGCKVSDMTKRLKVSLFTQDHT